MGLYIHSLSRLPLGVDADYYLYVLDYGWDEPLGDALRTNFQHIADLAGRHKAVIIAGTNPRAFSDEMISVHFDDPQFSWSNINGESGEAILPALMISTIHPQRFRDENQGYRPILSKRGLADEKLIIIPLRDTCKNSTDVMVLIEKIFRDIAEKKPLSGFSVSKEIKADSRGTVSDALILKPSIWGMGVDLRELARAFKMKRT
jgi:hypothetical protein